MKNALNEKRNRQTPLVSIIIPAYNAAGLIRRGLESALTQTYENVEIVVVDDGSTDETYSILLEYADDERLKIFRQQNKGVSAARNNGLDHCSGDYIMFLDADDWLEENAVETILNETLKHDSTLIVCGCYSCDLVNGTIKRDVFSLPIRQELIPSYDAMLQVHTGKFGLESSCLKIFNKKVIDAHTLRFDERIHNIEDGLFVFTYLSYVDWYEYLPVPLWDIFHHQGSTTRSPYNSRKRSGVYAADEMLKYCKDDAQRERVLAHKAGIAKEVIKPCILSKDDTSKDIAFLKGVMKENRKYFFKYTNLRGKIAYLVFYYVPVPLLKKVMPLYYKNY